MGNLINVKSLVLRLQTEDISDLDYLIDSLVEVDKQKMLLVILGYKPIKNGNFTTTDMLLAEELLKKHSIK